MARVSEETLSTSWARPFALARYISPNNSSCTGQKSFSKASRLENIMVLPEREDAVQLSNERLTNRDSSRTGCLITTDRCEPSQLIRVRSRFDPGFCFDAFSPREPYPLRWKRL